MDVTKYRRSNSKRADFGGAMCELSVRFCRRKCLVHRCGLLHAHDACPNVRATSRFDRASSRFRKLSVRKQLRTRLRRSIISLSHCRSCSSLSRRGAEFLGHLRFGRAPAYALLHFRSNICSSAAILDFFGSKPCGQTLPGWQISREKVDVVCENALTSRASFTI